MTSKIVKQKRNYDRTFYVFNYNQVEPKDCKVVQQKVNNRIVEVLKPVTKVSWVPPDRNDQEKPYNVQSGTIYDKSNLEKLKASAIWKSGNENRFYWSTYQGWSRLNYRIKRGEHGIQLYKYDPDSQWYEDNERMFEMNAMNVKG